MMVKNVSWMSLYMALALVALALVALALVAHGEALAVSALEKSEATVGRVVGNYRLTNQDGQFVAFQSFKGKPLLLIFMYIDCPQTCSMINHSIKALREKMDPATLAEIKTVSVTIDVANDSSKRLKEYGHEFTDNFDSWMFAWVDRETLKKMTNDLGFAFEKTGGSFEHMNRLTLVGPDGRVARHFYGTSFNAGEVEKNIKALLEGRSLKNTLSSAFNKILIYCSSYDPLTGTYKVDYRFISAVIIQYLLIMGTFVYFFRAKIRRVFKKFSKRVTHAEHTGQAEVEVKDQTS